MKHFVYNFKKKTCDKKSNFLVKTKNFGRWDTSDFEIYLRALSILLSYNIDKK